MLRFDQHSRRDAQRAARRERRSVWMLLLLLGMVIVLIKQLERPQTAAYFERVFGERGESTAVPVSLDEELRAERRVEPAVDASRPPWSEVQDNASFLTAEHDAWFSLFETVRRESTETLSRRSLGDAAYVQLIDQPRTYRGQVVRVRGRVVRESVKKAPQNELGIRDYHQLVLAPTGGGGFPMILYVLELPPGFPRGEGIAVDLIAEALFFKIWSFTDGEELVLAPVLVARTVPWRTSSGEQRPQAEGAGSRWGSIGIGAAAVIASALVVWAAAKLGRPRRERAELSLDLSGLESEP